MRRTGSLFEIDDEPLFEPGSLEADDASEQGWEDGYDDLPPALATVPRHEADEPGARLGGGWRSRVLVVVAAIGVAGFLGLRLTEVAGTPPVSSRAAGTSPPPAALAPTSDSVSVRRRQATRPRRTRTEHAPRRVRVSRRRSAARPAARASQVGPPVSAPLSKVPVSAAPSAPPPPPEPQGFTGEFF